MKRRTGLAWHGFRIALAAGLVVLAFLAISVGPLWFGALVPRSVRYRFIVRSLRAVQGVHGVVLVALPAALGALATALWRGRRRGLRQPRLARAFASCLALALSLALAEGIAAAWMARKPASPPGVATRFLARPASIAVGDAGSSGLARAQPDGSSDLADDRTVNIVILGGSSACGYPYDQWFSVARIVAWKLGESIPHRRFRVEHLAIPGIRLEMVQDLLTRLERRPDLAIIYAGHNEFDTRDSWQRSPPYYVDDVPAGRAEPASSLLEQTPLSRLIDRVAEKYRIAAPPPPRAAPRPLVDVPAYTAAEYAWRLDDFRRRLEAMTADFERLGALVVLLPPPSNDADFEPSRSFLAPRTTRAERDRFAREFQAARQVEEADASRAIVAYRTLLEGQPSFAEAHYRLARLLEAVGRRDEADRHYIAARDRDGYPVRCMSDFLNAYHEVEANHPRAILIDAPTLLRNLSRRGTLGDEFFADAHHPSLAGYTALSGAILRELHARRAFDWPAPAPAPAVTPADCAAHFGMDAEKWESVCTTICRFYTLCASIRFDPSERCARADRYDEAIRRIAEGGDPSRLHLPGIGIGASATSAPATVDTGTSG